MVRAHSLMFVCAISMLPIREAPAARPRVEIPIRLHAGAGWGIPAVDDETVYYLSKRHLLIAVDRHDGRPRWSAELGATGTTTAGTTVALAGALVVAGDHDVFALERSTGARRWRFDSGDDGPGRYLGEVSGTDVLAGSASGRAYAIDLRTGIARWATEPVSASATLFAPVVAHDELVAGYTDRATTPRAGGVVLIDRATGTIRWRAAFEPRDSRSATAFAGGPVVVGDLVVAASSDGIVHALDRTTGASRWTLPPIDPVDPLSGQPVPSEDFRAMAARGRTLVIGSTSGLLVGVDVDHRRELWRSISPPDGSIGFGLRIDEQTAYVPHVSGGLVAVSLGDGHARWRAGSAALPLFWPPARHDRFLYLTTEGGLYAIHD